MLRDNSFHLHYMLEAAQLSQSFTRGRVRADLEEDLMLFYALIKAVEIVGEAASHITQRYRASHPEIEWADIIGMRNWLVHSYYDINRDVVWETVRDDAPILIAQLEAVLE